MVDASFISDPLKNINQLNKIIPNLINKFQSEKNQG